MDAAPPVGLLGRLAVHYRLITMDQLSAALEAHSRAPQKQLGHVLVELGMISESQLGQLVQAQQTYLAQQAQAQEAQAQEAPPTQAVAAGTDAARPMPARARPRAPTTRDRPAPPPPPPPRAGQRTAGNSGAPRSLAPRTPMRPPRRRNPKDESARVEWLHRVLTHAVSSRASDVHLHAGTPVQLRIRGQLVPMSRDVLTPDNAEATLRAALTDEHLETLDELGEVDLAYEVPHVARFRASVYQQHGGLCGVYHAIPTEPPSLTELGLPTQLARLTSHRTGLVLVSGPAGSGKTSTMAALIALMNEERTDHILSLEDPIEFIHESSRCLVNQRQVLRHTHSFSAALRSALREDPDIICIGELRDLTTISLALSAAETGHLVIGTMHTLGSIRTINRIIGSYPRGQQGQIRAMLSESLRAVISQRLLPSSDGQRMVLAYELLIANQAAANLIRESRTFQLSSVIQTGRHLGMRSMDDSLMELVRSKHVTKETAREYADNPNTFR